MLRLRLILSGLVLLIVVGWALAQNQPQEVPKGVKALRDVAYVEKGHERQKLDLYLPEKADGPLPVDRLDSRRRLAGGSKDGCPARAFAAKGYAVASINYRLSQQRRSPPRSRTARRRSAGCGPTPRSTTSIPTASASGAPRPAATWSPCWAPPAA